jgi:hypothetical protein
MAGARELEACTFHGVSSGCDCLAGCGAGKPQQITVVNNSTSVLSGIQLQGIGFKQIIDGIEPNESKTVTVVPDGESSVTLDAITRSGISRQRT